MDVYNKDYFCTMEVNITYKDVPLLVIGEFDEGDKAEMYHHDLSGYHGTPASFLIEEIFVEDSEHSLLYLLSSELEEIERLILEKYEKI